MQMANDFRPEESFASFRRLALRPVLSHGRLEQVLSVIIKQPFDEPPARTADCPQLSASSRL